MREALRRRCCLWWLCLAAATTLARAPAAPVVEAEARQGQCEVLDLSLQQPLYSLPTKLTVRPSAPGWQLDFTLWATQTERAEACVRLEEKQSRLRLLLFKGLCDEGNLEDYNYLGDASATPRAWTSLGVDVTEDTVLVTAPDGNNTSLKANNMLVPHDGLQVASASDVEAAVGCRVTCPAYRHASAEKDKKITVKSWLEENVYFYFLHGSAFVRLEYEVKCKSSIGPTFFFHVTGIEPNPYLPRNLWHVVHLQHLSGKATVHLDNQPLIEKQLPIGCTFTEHTVKVEGDCLFSFTCNPFSGKPEEGGGKRDSTACPTTPVHVASHPAMVVLYTLVIEAVLLTVGYGVWQCYDQQKKTITAKQEQQQNTK